MTNRLKETDNQRLIKLWKNHEEIQSKRSKHRRKSTGVKLLKHASPNKHFKKTRESKNMQLLVDNPTLVASRHRQLTELFFTARLATVTGKKNVA